MSAITDKPAYNPVIENKKAVRISTVLSDPASQGMNEMKDRIQA